MRERATLAGGWLHVEAEPGKGTSVEAWIPRLPESHEPEAAEVEADAGSAEAA
jgi:signal transduction histidine kinase